MAAGLVASAMRRLHACYTLALFVFSDGDEPMSSPDASVDGSVEACSYEPPPIDAFAGPHVRGSTAGTKPRRVRMREMLARRLDWAALLRGLTSDLVPIAPARVPPDAPVASELEFGA